MFFVQSLTRVLAPAAPEYPSSRAPLRAHERVSSSLPAAERLQAVCQAVGSAEVSAASGVYLSAAAALAEAGSATPAAELARVPAAVADALAEWAERVDAACTSGAIAFAPAAGVSASAAAAATAERLRQQRDAWLAEEAAWTQLAADGQAQVAAAEAAVAAAEPQAPPGAEPAAAAAAAAVAAVAAGTVEGTLSAVVAEAARRLELQVDAVAALVTSADVLASRADAACATLAGALAEAELAVFAAAGSPRQLLRSLAQPR